MGLTKYRGLLWVKINWNNRRNILKFSIDTLRFKTFSKIDTRTENKWLVYDKLCQDHQLQSLKQPWKLSFTIDIHLTWYQ